MVITEMHALLKKENDFSTKTINFLLNCPCQSLGVMMQCPRCLDLCHFNSNSAEIKEFASRYDIKMKWIVGKVFAFEMPLTGNVRHSQQPDKYQSKDKEIRERIDKIKAKRSVKEK